MDKPWLCLPVPSSQGPNGMHGYSRNSGLTQTFSIMDLRSSAPVSEKVALCNLLPKRKHYLYSMFVLI